MEPAGQIRSESDSDCRFRHSTEIMPRLHSVSCRLLLPAVLSILCPILPGAASPAEVEARTEVPDAPRGIDDLREIEKRVRDVVAKALPATVSVGGGSGVIVSEEGHVLTVAHVIQRPGRTIRIRLPDGQSVRAKTLGLDRGLDAGLALILDAGPWPHVEMGESSRLRRGQWCVATGYPVPFRGRRGPAVRLGRVLRQDRRAVVTDCSIMGGDSGGPLFDLEGRVIGVSSRCDQNVTRNIHVPVDVYSESWERFVKGEEIDTRGRGSSRGAFLGISAPPVSDPDSDADSGAARVGAVVPGSAAEQAGLRAGDRIVEVDDTAVESFNELRTFLGRKRPGDRIQLRVERDGKELELEATLGRRSGG